MFELLFFWLTFSQLLSSVFSFLYILHLSLSLSLSFFLFSLAPILPCVWKPGWANHWSVARFLVSRVSAFFAVSPVSDGFAGGWGGGRAPNPPLAHRGWLRTWSEKPRHVNHYELYHSHTHLSPLRGSGVSTLEGHSSTGATLAAEWDPDFNAGLCVGRQRRTAVI